jgi:hypothetical protein
MQLFYAREEVHACALLRVVGAALVRIFAVAQVEHLRESRDELVRKRLDIGEPACDRRLVRRRRCERLRGEGAPHRQ